MRSTVLCIRTHVCLHAYSVVAVPVAVAPHWQTTAVAVPLAPVAACHAGSDIARCARRYVCINTCKQECRKWVTRCVGLCIASGRGHTRRILLLVAWSSCRSFWVMHLAAGGR